MKKRQLHIAVFIFLSSCLFFNQVGLNFFHDSHEAHEYFAATQKNKTMLLSHGEHCQVCSLEVLFNVVVPVSIEIPTQFFAVEFDAEKKSGLVTIFSDRSKTRGPPAAV